MREQNQEIEQEINLRDYINVVIKRRKLILTILFVSAILAAVVSLMAPKVYQGTALIMIVPSRMQSTLSPNEISLDYKMDSVAGTLLGQNISTSLATHKQLLKTTVVLDMIIDKLQLMDKRGKKINTEDLSKRLSVKDAKETGILQLDAISVDPEEVQKLANTWAQEYVVYNQELISGEVRGTGDFVVDQFEIAKKNLIESEQSLREFDANEGLALMRIELLQKQNELDSNCANMYKLEFQITSQEENFRRISEDIAAMSIDGKWIGSIDAELHSDNMIVDEKLSSEQRALRQKVLDVKKDLEGAVDARNTFMNNSNIGLLRQEIDKKRTTLVNDKIALTEIERLYKSTEDNIKSEGSLERLRQGQGSLSQNLPDSTLWEILSLEEKYNFFRSHQQTLQSKVKEEAEGLQQFEKKLFKYEKQLGRLEEKAANAGANYKFYFDKFKAIEAARNSIEPEIRDLKFRLSQAIELVKKLDIDVQSLKEKINHKEAKSMDLQRQVAIYKRSYDNLSVKIEEARIAKAAQLGEVKIVSPSAKPKNPVGSKGMQNVAITGILSLIFGTFLAFFIEYWKKTNI